MIAVNALPLQELRHTPSVLHGGMRVFRGVDMRYAEGALIENGLIKAFLDDAPLLIFFTVRLNTYCEHLGITYGSLMDHLWKRFVKIIVDRREILAYHSKRLRETPGHSQEQYTQYHHMKLPNIIKNPPAYIAVPLCLISAALYMGALILLKNLLH